MLHTWKNIVTQIADFFQTLVVLQIIYVIKSSITLTAKNFILKRYPKGYHQTRNLRKKIFHLKMKYKSFIICELNHYSKVEYAADFGGCKVLLHYASRNHEHV